MESNGFTGSVHELHALLAFIEAIAFTYMLMQVCSQGLVDRIVDEFTPLRLSPPLTDLPMPRTLHMPKKWKIVDVLYKSVCVFNCVMLPMVDINAI